MVAQTCGATHQPHEQPVFVGGCRTCTDDPSLHVRRGGLLPETVMSYSSCSVDTSEVEHT